MNVEPPVTCTFLSSSPELDDNVNTYSPILDHDINIFIENIFKEIAISIEYIVIFRMVWFRGKDQ